MAKGDERRRWGWGKRDGWRRCFDGGARRRRRQKALAQRRPDRSTRLSRDAPANEAPPPHRLVTVCVCLDLLFQIEIDETRMVKRKGAFSRGEETAGLRSRICFRSTILFENAIGLATRSGMKRNANRGTLNDCDLKARAHRIHTLRRAAHDVSSQSGRAACDPNKKPSWLQAIASKTKAMAPRQRLGRRTTHARRNPRPPHAQPHQPDAANSDCQNTERAKNEISAMPDGHALGPGQSPSEYSSLRTRSTQAANIAPLVRRPTTRPTKPTGLSPPSETSAVA